MPAKRNRWAVGMTGEGHQTRTRDRAKLRSIVNDLCQNQPRICCQAKVFFYRGGIVDDQQIGSSEQVEGNLPTGERVEIDSYTFFSGVQKMVISAVLQVIQVSQEWWQ